MEGETENMNNNPLVIPLDSQANIQTDQSSKDNQSCQIVEENKTNTQNQSSNEETSGEYPSPISTDSITSPSQGASSTQESLSELSSGPPLPPVQSLTEDSSEPPLPPPQSLTEDSSEPPLPTPTSTLSHTDTPTIIDSTEEAQQKLSTNTSQSAQDSTIASPVEDSSPNHSSGQKTKTEDSDPCLAQQEQFASTSSHVRLSHPDTNSSSSSSKDTTNLQSVQTNCDTVDPSTSDPNVYHVKWIEFSHRNCAIITQNVNGPCPLISIINVLLLRGRMSLPAETEMVSAEQLLQYLADLVLNQADSDQKDPNLQRNHHDCIAVLPRLATGLDVNVKFTGVADFEYTPELLIFDILNIDLFHGWLVDPQAEDVGLAVSGYSYNQLVEKIITNRMSNNSEEYSQSLLAEQFLQESASQLTYHGLYELTSNIQEQCTAVFFRNNHFSTIYKKNGELFLLVTDQGYLNQGDVVWETLANIEGDGHFVNHLFQTSGVDERLQGKDLPSDSLERDWFLAETLQREGDEASQRESLFQMFKNKHFGEGRDMSDEELAKKLQEVENRAAEEAERRNNEQQESGASNAPRPQNPIGPRSSKKNKDCTIL